MFQKEQEDGRDGLHDDLLVPVDIHSELHALQHCGPATKVTCSDLRALKTQPFPVFSPVYHESKGQSDIEIRSSTLEINLLWETLTASPPAARLQGC